MPLVVLLTSLGFGGLVVRDHLLPALEPSPAEAQPAATAGREPEHLVPAPPTQPASARRQLPLLSGDAAKRAIEQQRRQTALQKLQQPWTGEGMPPAL